MQVLEAASMEAITQTSVTPRAATVISSEEAQSLFITVTAQNTTAMMELLNASNKLQYIAHSILFAMQTAKQSTKMVEVQTPNQAYVQTTEAKLKLHAKMVT